MGNERYIVKIKLEKPGRESVRLVLNRPMRGFLAISSPDFFDISDLPPDLLMNLMEPTTRAERHLFQDFLIGTFIEEQMKGHGFESAVHAACERFCVRGRRRAARSTITDAYRRYRQRQGR
jgi:hypothetical protein